MKHLGLFVLASTGVGTLTAALLWAIQQRTGFTHVSSAAVVNASTEADSFEMDLQCRWSELRVRRESKQTLVCALFRSELSLLETAHWFRIVSQDDAGTIAALRSRYGYEISEEELHCRDVITQAHFSASACPHPRVRTALLTAVGLWQCELEDRLRSGTMGFPE